MVYCDLEVGNKCWEQYILSRFDNFKTKQILNVEYFNLKHRSKVSCQTGSASTLLYDPHAFKNRAP